MEKIWKYIKSAVFIVASVVILLFAKDFVAHEGKNISLYVGLLMCFYGVEAIIVCIVKNEILKRPVKFLTGLINVLLAVIMIFIIRGHFEAVRVACTIWCIWSIMREAEEIYENTIEEFKEHPFISIVNLLESIIVVIFSVILIKVSAEAVILEEVVEDAIKHVYLLGVELLLAALTPFMQELETKLWKKSRK